MKRKLMGLWGCVLVTVLAYPGTPAHATTIAFYSDGVIQPGDAYDIVEVHDTPPFQTTVDMTGGDVGRSDNYDSGLFAYDSSTVNISGGRVTYLRTYNSSSVNISGGWVGDWEVQSIRAHDTSNINVYNGANLVGDSFGSLDVFDSAVLNVYGGLLNLFVVAWDSSVVNVHGGYLFQLGQGANSTVNIYGGYMEVFGRNIVVPETATMNIYGYGFNYEPEAEWRSWNGPADGWWVSKLTGHGFDGVPITYWGLPDPAAFPNITLIPEPATVMLLLAGGIFLVGKNRKRHENQGR